MSVSFLGVRKTMWEVFLELVRRKMDRVIRHTRIDQKQGLNIGSKCRALNRCWGYKIKIKKLIKYKILLDKSKFSVYF